MKSNPILYAIIGGLVALVIAIGGYLVYDKITRRNDTETAQKMYELRNMSQYELSKPTNDILIKEERARRLKEVTNSLYIQNRD